MEETKKTSASKELIFNYGGLLGLVSIIIASVNFAFGNRYEPHWSVTIISLTITTIIIVKAIQKLKNAQDGYLTLTEAIKLGLGISLISALIYVIFLFILTGYIEPDYFNNVLELQRASIIEQNPDLTDDQIEKSMNMIKGFTNSYVTAAIAVIISLFIGFVISIIGGSIMKKNRELN